MDGALGDLEGALPPRFLRIHHQRPGGAPRYLRRWKNHDPTTGAKAGPMRLQGSTEVLSVLARTEVAAVREELAR